MFKHPSSTSPMALALLLTLSLSVQSFPVTRSRIVFSVQTKSERTTTEQRANPQPQPPQLAVAQKGLAPEAINIVATLQDSGWPAYNAADEPNPLPASTGNTVTYTAVISNTGTTDALNVTFNDIINVNTSTLSGSPTLSSVLVGDVYTSIGNVGINSATLTGCSPANTCEHVTDNDSITGGEVLTQFAASQATLISGTGTAINGSNTVTTTNGGTVLMNTNGSFTYNPAAGFTGSDAFFYAVNGPTGLATAKVTINVSTPIWFIDAAAGGGGTGTLANPFNCLTGVAPGCFSQVNDGGAGHPKDNDSVFMYSNASPYNGGLTLRNGQKLIGKGASTSLASIAGVTPSTESNALPTTSGTNPTVTTVAAATNGINIGVGFSNTLRGFTIGNTTGTKIASGVNFGTLTLGNNATPDMTLNGSGKALDLASGALAVTSGFSSVTSTSSGTQGINLAGITLSGGAGPVSFGSTTISGNTTQCILVGTTTANLNFGNTLCTGGTGVSFQNNSAGTRTFGTLTVTGSTATGFIHGAGGGNVTVTGAATLTSNGDVISVGAPGATNVIDFQGATSVTRLTAGGNGVAWVGTAGANLQFNSLTIQTAAGTGLSATTGGTVTVTNGTGTINNTVQAAPAIVANGITLNANFSAIKSSGGTNGVSLTTVAGTSNFGTGTLSGATGATFLVSGGSANVTYAGDITQATVSQPAVSVAGGHSGTLNFNTGTISATNGTGLQFDNADGTYNFETTAGSATLAGGDAGIDITNGSGGTFNFGRSASPSSFAITSPTGIAFNADGTAVALTANVTYSGNITQANNAAMVNVKNHNTGTTITFQSGTFSATNGTGLQFDNADGTYNFTGTTTLNGGDAGVDILNGSAGAFSFGGTAITNPTGVAFNVDGTSAAVTGGMSISGAISKNNDGKLVDFFNYDTGTATLSGNLSCTSTCDGIEVTNNGSAGTLNFSGGTKTLNTSASTAVNLGTNTGGAINFTGGGLDITTTSATGFNATGGGTITVQGTVNKINSTTGGTALNVANTTIGAGGLTFEKISAVGSSGNAGIALDTTGSSGSLTVVGTGGTCTSVATCTGGAISNRTGADVLTGSNGNGQTTSGTGGTGIFLKSTSNPVFNNMQLNDFTNFAIYGNSVTGFSLVNSNINGANGDNNAGNREEGSIRFDNLFTSGAFPTAQITGSTISGGGTFNLFVENTLSGSTLNRLLLANDTFGLISATIGNDNIDFYAQPSPASNNPTVKVTLQDCIFLGTRADFFEAIGDGNTIMDVVARGNKFQDGQTIIPGGGTAISLRGDLVGTADTMTFDISCNRMNGGTANSYNTVGMFIAKGNGAGSWSGSVVNNVIGPARTTPTVANADGLFVRAAGSGTLSVLIKDNTLSGYGNSGIHLQNNDGSSTMNATIVGNTESSPNTQNFSGIFVDNGATATDTSTMNVVIGSAGTAALQNTLHGVVIDASLSNFNASTTFRLYKNGSASGTAAGVIQDDNVGTPTVDTSGGAGAITLVAAGLPTVPATPTACTTVAVFQPDTPMPREYLARTEASPQSGSYSSSAFQYSPIAFASILDSVDRAMPTLLSPGTQAQPAKVAGTASLSGPSVRNAVSFDTLAQTIKPVEVAAAPHQSTAKHDKVSERSFAATTVKANHVVKAAAVAPVNHSVKTNAPREAVAYHSTTRKAVAADDPIAPTSGGTVTQPIGTLSAGSTVTIVFQVTINNAQPLPHTSISNQGNVTYTGGPGGGVLTDDPNTVAASDPTLTPLVQPTAADGTVTGTILDSNGNPVEGATVNLSGTQNRKFITDRNGHYNFNNVETGGFYTVVPTRVNYLFSPSQRSFSQLGNNTDATFTASATSGTALNPLDTPEYFVRQQYLDFLGREPDEAGFNFWSDQILGCSSDAACSEAKRSDVSAAFFFSIEFQQTGYLVYRMYQAAYGDMPEQPVPIRLAEFKPDSAKISNGVVVLKSGWEALLETNKQAFATEFVQRNRFTVLYSGLNDGQFVDTLDLNTGFVLTQSERDQLVSDLSSNTKTRAQVLRSVAENSTLAQREFNQAFVLMQYFGYLQRDANSGPDTDFTGYNFWLNKLNTFGGNYQQAEMVKAFLVAGEYRGRFPK